MVCDRAAKIQAVSSCHIFYQQFTNSPGNRFEQSIMPLTHWSQFALVSCVIIDPVNGLSRQAITWTNADVLSIGPLGSITLQRNLNENTIFLEKKCNGNAVCKMSAISHMPVGEVWGVFCKFKVRFMLCRCHCSDMCDIVVYWTAL